LKEGRREKERKGEKERNRYRQIDTHKRAKQGRKSMCLSTMEGVNNLRKLPNYCGN
jgi:hypothetical protein